MFHVAPNTTQSTLSRLQLLRAAIAAEVASLAALVASARFFAMQLSAAICALVNGRDWALAWVLLSIAASHVASLISQPSP
ncbi:MAG TPA: hypothetical protein VG900_15085 [Hyphomicrobiaceae bacterium]|nr:hypothetical protein [Hyphomicrobiaceae bacterium]